MKRHQPNRKRGRQEIYGPPSPGRIHLKAVMCRRLLREFCARQLISLEDLREGGRTAEMVAARRDFCVLSQKHRMGCVIVAYTLGVSHWTVQYWRNDKARARKVQRNRDIREEQRRRRLQLRSVSAVHAEVPGV